MEGFCFSRDRWVAGVSEQGSVRLVRTVTPRFMACVCGPHAAQEVEGKRHVMATGQVLHGFIWFDEPPGPGLLTRILAEAEEAWIYITAVHGHLAALVEE